MNDEPANQDRLREVQFVNMEALRDSFKNLLRHRIRAGMDIEYLLDQIEAILKVAALAAVTEVAGGDDLGTRSLAEAANSGGRQRASTPHDASSNLAGCSTLPECGCEEDRCFGPMTGYQCRAELGCQQAAQRADAPVQVGALDYHKDMARRFLRLKVAREPDEDTVECLATWFDDVAERARRTASPPAGATLREQIKNLVLVFKLNAEDLAESRGAEKMRQAILNLRSVAAPELDRVEVGRKAVDLRYALEQTIVGRHISDDGLALLEAALAGPAASDGAGFAEHVPRAYQGGGECWIQCSCGWNREGYQISDAEWIKHAAARAALPSGEQK